jgi:uncharacterized OsmC-like protein
MKITLTSDDSILLEPLAGPLTIEAPNADMQYSPFHMLASALATCTFSVLHSWASNAGIGWEDLSIAVKWTFAEQPHRVGSLDVELRWPSLPAERTTVALRASQLCAVHATLSHPPEIKLTRSNIPGSEPQQMPEVGMPSAAPAERIDESTSGP